MAFLAPLLGSAAGQAIGSTLLGGLAGGTRRSTPKQFKPVGINAGGFNLGVEGGRVTGGATEQRLGRIQSLSDLLGVKAGQIRGLRSKIRPGFSELRTALGERSQARLQNVRGLGQKAVGDLSANLQRRRVLGSSFGEDALSRTRAEFAQKEDVILRDVAIQEAQTFLTEIEQTKQLIGDEFAAGQASIQVFIDNMNLEAGIATQLATNATNALSENAQVQAQILDKEQSDIFELFSGVAGNIAENLPQIGKEIGGLF